MATIKINKSKIQQGISYIEIMVVVVILGIIAAVAMPNLSSNDSRKLDLAAKEVVEAIRFSRIQSITTKRPHGVNFDSNNDIIKVYSLVYSEFSSFPIWTPTFDVYHPVDKKLYTLNLNANSVTRGVNLQSYAVYFGGGSINTPYLGFNSSGMPKRARLMREGDLMLDSATITLAYAGQIRVISVAPMTGRVTVQ